MRTTRTMKTMEYKINFLLGLIILCTSYICFADHLRPTFYLAFVFYLALGLYLRRI